MKDPRMGKLAENLVRYSCHLEPGEKVLFETFDCPDFVLEALICAAYQLSLIHISCALPLWALEHPLAGIKL